jgi:hypothetical protein
MNALRDDGAVADPDIVVNDDRSDVESLIADEPIAVTEVVVAVSKRDGGADETVRADGYVLCHTYHRVLIDVRPLTEPEAASALNHKRADEERAAGEVDPKVPLVPERPHAHRTANCITVGTDHVAGVPCPPRRSS